MLRKILVLLGVAPSFLFFVWVERNAALPILPITLGWPWIEGESWPLELRILWNLLLFTGFALLHSGLATPHLKKEIAARLGGASWVRPIYVTVSGVALFLLMALWQSTGVILWLFPETLQWLPLPLGLHLFSLIDFAILFLALAVLKNQDLGAFLGLKEPSDSVNPKPVLLGGGAYRWVRHPIYTLTLLAFLLTSWMSLDRFLIFAATAIYLQFWGVPLEEKKLVLEFGTAYLDYQKKVPALFPGWPSRKPSTN